MLINVQNKLNKLLGVHKYYWNKRPNGVYSFNYHRIGDYNKTKFDPNIFSCDEEQFEKQVVFFKSNFDVISASELTDIINTKKSPKDRYALLTFDDGYIDNYTIAYPILKRANCPATMFIVTDFIDKQIVPWWDEVAWLIKNNDENFLDVSNWSLPKNIKTLPIHDKIKVILRSFKDNKVLSIKEKLNILRNDAANKIDLRSCNEQLFMTWDMVREMANNNIDIGSHTCTHQILSHLSVSMQLLELKNSKEIIEREIKKRVTAFAYPVGGANAFTPNTMELVKNNGYDHALTFIANINTDPTQNKYCLNRFSIDNNSSIPEIKNLIGLFTKNLNS